jgi:hypothetical protein
MIKYFNKNFFSIAIAIFFFGLICGYPVLSLAQNQGNPPVGGAGQGNPPVDDSTAGTLENPIQADNVIDLIKNILEGVIKIGMPIIALMLVYSGFLFVMARGNKGELETAKRNFMYVVIGAAILLGSWAIAQLISETVLQL